MALSIRSQAKTIESLSRDNVLLHAEPHEALALLDRFDDEWWIG